MAVCVAALRGTPAVMIVLFVLILCRGCHCAL